MELVDELGDAVPQSEIAVRAGLDEATTSSIARRLEEDGFFSRGIDGIDARCWRVFVSERGSRHPGSTPSILVRTASARFFATH